MQYKMRKFVLLRKIVYFCFFVLLFIVGINTSVIFAKNEISSEKMINTSKDNTNLQILRLDKEGMEPNFQKDIKEYYFITENANRLEITAVPENEKARVKVTGNTNLKQGLNTIRIQVESEDRSKKTEYKIYVTKTKNKESVNANLENLAIKEGMLYPPFDRSMTQYHTEVAYSTENITILAVPEKINATVQIVGENHLKVGDNTIVVTVLAEDRVTHKKYTLVVHRRNEEEERTAKEGQENQAKQVKAILGNIGEEKEMNILKDSEAIEENHQRNVKQISIKNKITFILLGIVIIAFVIGIILQYIKKNSRK